ncbi:TrkH family potassium uptake protein [Salinifilum ghardaiensis]
MSAHSGMRAAAGRLARAGSVARRAFADAGAPARMVVTGFAAAIAVGTVLLMLPIAGAGGEATSWVTALFTATSAVCVTGLVVVDTGGHWSLFGETVVLGLIQIGGLGIMTLASLLGLLVSHRLRLRLQRGAQTEIKSPSLGDVRRLLVGVITLSLLVEAIVAGVLTLRLVLAYGHDWLHAGYLGVFHAISAFNNAGFALHPDSLTRYAADGWVCLPVAAAFVLGGLGFPVLIEISRHLRQHGARWSLHARVTLVTYAVLAAVGVLAVAGLEWSNPATLGALDVPGRLLAALFHGLTPRTAGFNTIDVGEMHPTTLLLTDVFMFVGGGSAGTAGGIKVTTFAVLAFVIVTEIRGEPNVHVAGRKLPVELARQALTVALLGVGMVFTATLVLLKITPFSLNSVLFESVSAFGTVGLSTGITGALPPAAQLLLVVLMFTGRLGPITLASALALQERGRRFDRPEERPIVG